MGLNVRYQPNPAPSPFSCLALTLPDIWIGAERRPERRRATPALQARPQATEQRPRARTLPPRARLVLLCSALRQARPGLRTEHADRRPSQRPGAQLGANASPLGLP